MTSPGTLTEGALHRIVDVHVLAGVLATEAWPAERCKEVLARLLSRDGDGARDDHRGILDAIRTERPDDLLASLDRACALIPWDRVEIGPEALHALVRLWKEYALFLKAHLPSRLDDAVIRLFERVKHQPRTLRTVCDGAAEAKVTAGVRTTWQLGNHEVSHIGNPSGGRWTLRRTTPVTPPRPRLSSKSTAATPPPSKPASPKPSSKSKASSRSKARARAAGN